MVTRDEIIADWHSRLETAAASEGCSSARADWVARVRRRLYRFLLSLYGDGQWNAPKGLPASSSLPEAGTAAKIEPSGTITSLAGKPARSRDQIGAVLKAVAGASVEPPLPGPLLDGQGDDAWLPIASSNCDIDLQRYADLLRAERIIPRVVPRRGDCTVEVRVREFARAQGVLHRQMHRLRIPRRSIEQPRPVPSERIAGFVAGLVRRIPPLWRFFLLAACELALTFPAAWMAVTLVSLIQFGPEWKPLALDQGVFDHFWTVWRGLCVTMLLVIAAQYQDRLRSEKRAAAANHTGD